MGEYRVRLNGHEMVFESAAAAAQLMRELSAPASARGVAGPTKKVAPKSNAGDADSNGAIEDEQAPESGQLSKWDQAGVRKFFASAPESVRKAIKFLGTKEDWILSSEVATHLDLGGGRGLGPVYGAIIELSNSLGYMPPMKRRRVENKTSWRLTNGFRPAWREIDPNVP